MSDGSRAFPPLDAPSERFPYRIDRQVGIGSMGVVYKAVEVPLDRKVAIKVLRRSVLDEELPEVQEEIRRRFLQEARAAAALSHPGVTTVYRVGKEGDLPYMVMEWLDGRSLEEVLEDRPRLEVPEAVRLVVSLLETLDAAHRQGVVHRDVKPSNLMLLDDGRLKVTDFGIALFKGRELVKTQAGVVLATPKFASPEQLRGLDVDGRADLFAVGILLYRLVTGCFPFEGAGFLELTTAILQREPVPAREHHAGIPPALEAVLRRALRKSRRDRFATAAEMAGELRPFLSASPRAGTAGGATSRSGTGRGHAAGGEGHSAGGFVAGALAGGEPVYRELPLDPAAALARVAASWPGRELAAQATEELLDRLLEAPLHAPPFTGAVRIGDCCLLISRAVLVGAVDVRDGHRGDAAVESLPAISGPRLHPLPEDLSPRTVDHFVTLLREPRDRHGDLDTSLIDLEALARKLRQERFDGLLRLRFGEAFGAVLFAGGRSTLSLFSQGWGETPVERSWRFWLSRFPVRARVESLDVEPLDAWYRRHFRGLELAVAAAGSGAPELAPVASAELAAEALEGWRRAPAVRSLRWTLADLPRILAERERLSRWRYLGEWIPHVRRAWVYCDLPRPEEPAGDRFDWVTADEDGKVLHVGQRVARLTVPVLQAFLERVIAAKKARHKTGDVGAALLFAPELPEDVLDAYDRALASGAKAWFGVEESFTGYSGFVRIGARRGFHLLLVEDGDRGLTPLI